MKPVTTALREELQNAGVDLHRVSVFSGSRDSLNKKNPGRRYIAVKFCTESLSTLMALDVEYRMCQRGYEMYKRHSYTDGGGRWGTGYPGWKFKFWMPPETIQHKKHKKKQFV